LFAGPADIDGKRQVVTMGDHLVGVTPKNRRIRCGGIPTATKWAVHPNTPVLCGSNRVFNFFRIRLRSGDGRGFGRNAKLVWSVKASDNHFQGAALYRGRIFSSGGGKFSCFDPADGREV
jgi:hypothetical protein